MAKTSAERMAAHRTRKRIALVDRDGRVCRICGGPILDGQKVQIDHRIPRALGGTDDPKNLQLAHKDCNLAKSDRLQLSVHRALDIAVMSLRLVHSALAEGGPHAVAMAMAIAVEGVSTIDAARNLFDGSSVTKVTDDRHNVTDDVTVTVTESVTSSVTDVTSSEGGLGGGLSRSRAGNSKQKAPKTFQDKQGVRARTGDECDGDGDGDAPTVTVTQSGNSGGVAGFVFQESGAGDPDPWQLDPALQRARARGVAPLDDDAAIEAARERAAR